MENRSHCIIKLEIRSKVDYYSKIVREINATRRSANELCKFELALRSQRNVPSRVTTLSPELSCRPQSRWNSEENFP